MTPPDRSARPRAARAGACARRMLAPAPALVALALTVAHAPAIARDLPLWEAGGGVTGLVLPDYRGSDRLRGYVLPFPYLNYRGDMLKYERERLRGKFFGTDFVELDFSLNGSPPVKSENNDARRGMNDLDPTFEIGPALRFNLFESADKRREVSLRLPIRMAVATDFSHVKGIGYTFSPSLGYDVRNVRLFGNPGWNVGAFGTWLYGSQKYHDYFYSVRPEYAVSGRPSYAAGSGAAGWNVTATLSKRFDRFWIGGFLRYDTVAGASFEESPLVRRTANVFGGVAIGWIFAQSKSRVDALE
jgi:outer membrane scaffolding protein for murein synthesis (MipA/OmpV family)